MTDTKRILDKIKKCLALSKSANENEAATALRQAQKLMEAHSISELDVLSAIADERATRTSASNHPPAWEVKLSSLVANAFGCHYFFQQFSFSHFGEWHFIGCAPAPEIAQYTMDVLLRQVKKLRAEFIKTKLTRCALTTKTRRADIF